MTTETERRVPEHPGWQQWWVRYAEFAGSTVVLGDRDKWRPCHDDNWAYPAQMYWIGTGAVRACRVCGKPSMFSDTAQGFDDLAEAEAAFEAACERLREGG